VSAGVDVFLFPEMSHLDDLFAPYSANMTVAQLGEVLGIGRATTYKWLNAGEIPAYRVGGSWVILRDEVKEFIAAGRNIAERIGDEVEELVDDVQELADDVADEIKDRGDEDEQ
jgi:excisionase family DNA binding protein